MLAPAHPNSIGPQVTPVSDPTPGARASSAVRVRVVRNGPLQVRGAVELIDHDGKTYNTGGRETVLLCRCGGSASKPFRDGTHSHIGFADAGRAVSDADAATRGSADAVRQIGGNS
ncbi:Zn-finger domain of CDGSH type-containing protein [Blastococcus aurantiacus]|uniref:Zn-finger domain of CDGSH type-containing protein n=1 Tax=Blastococcus aurantiacus TaxID=1550231 RepID=A0A1G7R3V4_9ACTN|nr:Zn-finger domain of CDGSH type-containing protein [Blastococcus aurantiacus]